LIRSKAGDFFDKVKKRNEENKMSKNLEIEKKFKVKKIPEHLEQYEKKVMEQGYLCSNPIVRIRRSNEEYILTYKSRFGLENDKETAAKVCHEVEVPLNREGYEHLREKIDGNLIEKTRYMIPLEMEHLPLKAELDIFEGKFAGLVIVEVEFPDQKTAERFQPPEWFGEDVSLDRQYTNNYLATKK
jgi:CYTH domain-containing protein